MKLLFEWLWYGHNHKYKLLKTTGVEVKMPIEFEPIKVSIISVYKCEICHKVKTIKHTA